MYIKESPVEGVKREYAGFQLDTNKIDLHSAEEEKIILPYSGVLPDKLNDIDGAFVAVNVKVGLSITVCLVVTMDGKKHRFPVEATAQEINDILFSLFFRRKNETSFETRWDCGLSQYFLGNVQSSYTHWRRFVVEGLSIDDLIRQLPSGQLDSLARYIDELRKTA